jgi:hypothetical protein
VIRRIDPNNRPGGPNLIVTAKTAHKVHFLDAATLAMTATIDMPGSTHEIALSLDGRTAYASVYGEGVFAKRINPDRRIVVIDLPSKSLTRVIDLGDVYAPHGVMIDGSGMVWSSGELGNAVLVIDPAGDKVHKIDVAATAHWVAVSHATGKVFASVKQDHVVAVDSARRTVIEHQGPARGRGASDFAGRRNALRLRANRGRVLCDRCSQPRAAADRADRRRRRLEAANAAGAGVARQQIRGGLVEPGSPRGGLPGRRAQADRVVPDQEIAHGLRLRPRRQARLSLLPRRRRGVRVRARQRAREPHLPDRGRLRVHRGVSLNLHDKRMNCRDCHDDAEVF